MTGLGGDRTLRKCSPWDLLLESWSRTEAANPGVGSPLGPGCPPGPWTSGPRWVNRGHAQGTDYHSFASKRLFDCGASVELVLWCDCMCTLYMALGPAGLGSNPNLTTSRH